MFFNKIPSISILLLFFLPAFVSAQAPPKKNIGYEGMYKMNGFTQFDLREQKSIYQVFLNDEWQSGQLVYRDGEITEKKLLLRYDVLNQQLNTNISGAVFNVPVKNLGGFLMLSKEGGLIKKQLFIFDKLAADFSDKMFFEVLEEGPYSLLAHHTCSVQSGTSGIKALDVGTDKKRTTQKISLYLKGAKGIYKIPKKKKEAVAFFQAYPKAMEYIKNNKVKFKKTKTLAPMIQFMNQS